MEFGCGRCLTPHTAFDTAPHKTGRPSVNQFSFQSNDAESGLRTHFNLLKLLKKICLVITMTFFVSYGSVQDAEPDRK